MKGNTPGFGIARSIRWIARILSALLTLFNGAYIILATLMIVAARQELFPKMAYSFLALALLSVALVASWRWEVPGAIGAVAALFAYQMAERSRLGYGPRSYWYVILTASIALLFLTSSVLHWWIRKRPPGEPA
jgi:sterol desaturase/sphingolipid hydroxylase (fatty acid hydroxylase superfamily)